jgi:hypothetical protein
MKKALLTACTVLALLLTPAAAMAESEMVLVEVSPVTWQGQAAYEYIYDIYGTPYNDFHLQGLDPSGILNLYEGAMWDKWDGWAAGYESWITNWDPWTYQSPHYPSYGEGDTADEWWIHPAADEIVQNHWGNPEYWGGRGYDPVHAATHGVVNGWHLPSEYGDAGGNSWMGGAPRTIAGGDAYDGLYFGYFTVDTHDWSGDILQMTIRLIHSDGPNGTIIYQPDGFDPTYLVGPAPGGEPGDFDADGDVDADDVDLLCANMGGDPVTYDMDGDGDVDEDDMTYHVENYLEYDSDGDGTADGAGTFRGDFNADGLVNGTDLSIMSGSFGTATGFGGGNANCDATVNGTDLSILSGVFGNIATAAIPEPATIALLSLGGVAMIRRRK